MKILVIKTSSLGDVIHTLPAITDAVRTIPNLQIDWVVEEAFAEIPKMHFAVNNVIVIAWRRWRKNIFKALSSGEIQHFFRKLREQKYDYIIDAQGLLKSAVLGLVAHGKRIGFNWRSAREPISSLCYDKSFFVAKNQHAIKRLRQLFALSLDYQVPNSDPDYAINQKAPNDFANDKYILFFHGSSRDEKCWSEAKWIELARIAHNDGYRIYLPWGNEKELKRAERIAKEAIGAKALPKQSLTQLVDIIVNSRGIIAVDSGLGHLAAAFGVPTVSLYGPTNPDLIGSVGKNQKHLLDFNSLSAQQVWDVLGKFF